MKLEYCTLSECEAAQQTLAECQMKLIADRAENKILDEEYIKQTKIVCHMMEKVNLRIKLIT